MAVPMDHQLVHPAAVGPAPSFACVPAVWYRDAPTQHAAAGSSEGQQHLHALLHTLPWSLGCGAVLFLGVGGCSQAGYQIWLVACFVAGAGYKASWVWLKNLREGRLTGR